MYDLKASDWTYIAEGGKHAVFSYIGDVTPSSDPDDGLGQMSGAQLYGNVLRIVKSYFLSAVAYEEQKKKGVKPVTSGRYKGNDVMSVGSVSVSDKIGYSRRIIQPQLGEAHLDLPELIPVANQFLIDLYNQTLESNVIPQKRLGDWAIPEEPIEDPASYQFITMLKDHSKLPLLPSSGDIDVEELTKKSLSIEIKPKAGFVPCSPFLARSSNKSTRQMKLKFSKFELKQRRMVRGSIIAPWLGAKGNLFSRSNYNPLDLFSGDVDRVQSTLQAVTKTMQNNFRVWYQGIMIFGNGVTPADGPNKDSSSNILQHIFQLEPPESEDQLDSLVLENIVKTLPEILVKDTFLPALLATQRLNVISDDGAIVIYKQFVTHFDGSTVAAENYLNNYCIVAKSKGNKPNDGPAYDLFCNSPYPYPSDDSSALDQLCQQITVFREKLAYDGTKSQSPDALDPDQLDQAFDEAMSIVPQLNQVECAFILANWLLSLCVVDVSFFVTIQPTVADDGSLTFNHAIKVVDCDPKAAKSLTKRSYGKEKH
jgi:hypothetical protein